MARVLEGGIGTASEVINSARVDRLIEFISILCWLCSFWLVRITVSREHMVGRVTSLTHGADCLVSQLDLSAGC
jgi:hypothetical protein